jgi:hypothetical protein
MGIIIALAAKELVLTWPGEGRTLLRQALFTRSSLQNFRTWGSALRKLDGLKVFPLLWRAYDFRSDIAGNYSILFGIKKSAIDNHSLAPFIKNLEVRVPGPVSFMDMTHVEVPLENVEETRQVLRQNNITLPVIPLEFSEIYCSQFSLQRLMYVQKEIARTAFFAQRSLLGRGGRRGGYTGRRDDCGNRPGRRRAHRGSACARVPGLSHSRRTRGSYRYLKKSLSQKLKIKNSTLSKPMRSSTSPRLNSTKWSAISRTTYRARCLESF